ncbi:MAG: hypothetical protein ACI97P_002924 [Arcticibacterium sp.]|jgi:hypothetical protein
MAEKKYIFKKTDGEYINSTTADGQKAAYIKAQNDAGDKDPIRSQFYGSEMLSEMIGRTKAVGIRFANGLSVDGEPTLVLIALNENGDEIPKENFGVKDDGAGNGGNGPTCPPKC